MIELSIPSVFPYLLKIDLRLMNGGSLKLILS